MMSRSLLTSEQLIQGHFLGPVFRSPSNVLTLGFETAQTPFDRVFLGIAGLGSGSNKQTQTLVGHDPAIINDLQGNSLALTPTTLDVVELLIQGVDAVFPVGLGLILGRLRSERNRTSLRDIQRLTKLINILLSGLLRIPLGLLVGRLSGLGLGSTATTSTTSGAHNRSTCSHCGFLLHFSFLTNPLGSSHNVT